MNGRDKRRARAARGRAWEQERAICTACGGQGRHFVPPSFGEGGYFSCRWGPRPPKVLFLPSVADPSAPTLEEIRQALALPGVESVRAESFHFRGRGG